MQKPFFLLPAPLSFALVVGVAWLLNSLWPWPLASDLWSFYAGCGLIDIGAVFLLWSAWLMFWRKTTLSPYGKPQLLLREGPFRFSRNPIYLALLLIYMGIALLWAQLWAWLLVPVVILLLNFGVIRYEEALLQKHFGDEYVDYCKKVRRWI